MLRSLRTVLHSLPVCLSLLATLPAAYADTPPGVLVIGQVAEPQSLDPQVATAANDSRILVNIYDGLVRNAPGSLSIEPALASRWEISPTG